MRRSPLTLLRIGLGLLGACAAGLGALPIASASGPVERMVQLLPHPADPNVLVVRYGVASEGYLFSRDGGRSFRAMCSQVIDSQDDKVLRLSSQAVPGTAATVLDGSGKLVIALPLDTMYTDDGNGCGWQADPTFSNEQYVYGLQRDPRNSGDLLATATARRGDDDTTAQLMRRAGGRWSVVAPLRARRAGETTLAGDLLVSEKRLYASVSINSTTSSPAYRVVLVASDDNGATWREAGTLPSDDTDDLVLLGVDPGDPDRLVGVNYEDAGPDALHVSTDGGKTFRDYGTVAAASGITFAPDGRVFVGDAGDQDAQGGVWTAPRLGDPLVKIEGTDSIDCIGLEPDSGKLRVCRRHRFGLMDASTGAFEELTRLDKVQSLIECEGVDMHAACETQLNSGPSWCCTGHYSFTPFCGSYDVTRVGNRNVYCGLSGQQYDLESGRGPEPDVDPDVTPQGDGGVEGRDAGRGTGDGGARRDGGVASDDDDEGATGSTGSPRSGGGGGGCAVRTSAPSPGDAGGLLLSLGALLLVLGRRSRRVGR